MTFTVTKMFQMNFVNNKFEMIRLSVLFATNRFDIAY